MTTNGLLSPDPVLCQLCGLDDAGRPCDGCGQALCCGCAAENAEECESCEEGW